MTTPPNSEVGAEVENLVADINALQQDTERPTTITQPKPTD